MDKLLNRLQTDKCSVYIESYEYSILSIFRKKITKRELENKNKKKRQRTAPFIPQIPRIFKSAPLKSGRQVMKTTKIMKKMMRIRNILMSSQRLLDTDWKYLSISVCARSTFSWVSSTLASILSEKREVRRKNYCLFIHSVNNLPFKSLGSVGFFSVLCSYAHQACMYKNSNIFVKSALHWTES